MKIQIWPMPQTMDSGALRFHILSSHSYYAGDLRDVRRLRKDHALMHTAEWANPDTTPHAHQEVAVVSFIDITPQEVPG